MNVPLITRACTSAVLIRPRTASQVSENDMVRKLTLAGFAVVGLLGIPLNAQADQITLGNNNLGGITVTGTGTLANVTIAAGTGCIASFGCATFQSALPAELGGYSLGPFSFTAGPQGA